MSRSLDEFLSDYDRDDNEWWRLDPGDQLNLFDELRARAEKAEAAVRSAHTYCARPAGVCLPIEPLP